jgi:hypothetical protein
MVYELYSSLVWDKICFLGAFVVFFGSGSIAVGNDGYVFRILHWEYTAT